MSHRPSAIGGLVFYLIVVSRSNKKRTPLCDLSASVVKSTNIAFVVTHKSSLNAKISIQ